MTWVNENAGAVQAIMAIVIGLLTAVLIRVTWRYVNLTQAMSLTMERQLASSFEPNIQMDVKTQYGNSGQREFVRGRIIIRNDGPLPLKVVATAMKVVYDNNRFPIQMESEDAHQRVVSPGGATNFDLEINIPMGGTRADYEQIAQIHCSDLAGVSKHSFSKSSRVPDQLNHSIGFQPI